MTWELHKFGGTSLANSDEFKNVAHLVKNASQKSRTFVVVSAMGGVTDLLMEGLRRSAENKPFEEQLKAIEQKVASAATDLLSPDAQKTYLAEFKSDLVKVKEVLKALSLLRIRHKHADDLISGHGELWSARLLTSFLNRERQTAHFLDARTVLTMSAGELVPLVEQEKSKKALDLYLAEASGIIVATGYIASNEDGLPTTLGRNGSDYSASIFASLLDAKELHIWTDVDGVMSADPREVPRAVVLDSLSYDEAMELAYFGAKVIHPATLAPAMEKNLPIRVRNSHRPELPGTIISRNSNSKHAVKGFAVIREVSLLNVEGSGMLGIPGVAERLFGALRDSGVSVILISQASSEHSICFAVQRQDAEQAKRIAQQAFHLELSEKQIQRIEVLKNCAVLAAVGDKMAGTPGVAAKLLGALANANVNILAIAQGSSERNISVVVQEELTTKALRAAHSGFFLSPQTLSIGVFGVGVVGKVLLEQLRDRQTSLKEEANIDLRVRAIANSKRALFSDQGIDLSEWETGLRSSGKEYSVDEFRRYIQSDEAPHSVIVDCTSSEDIAGHYQEWLKYRIHVVTPNKKAGSSSQNVYDALQQERIDSRSHFLYETTVGAGLPILQTAKELVKTGDRLISAEGVLSGTLSYLFNKYDGSGPFSKLLLGARESGYTEPDPRDDLSGMDVARKVVILGREFGLKLSIEDVSIESLVPSDLVDVSLEEFLEQAHALDAPLLDRFSRAKAEGRCLRYVGRLDQSGNAKVALETYTKDHPFARIVGTDNIVLFKTERYLDNPLIVQGPGAGPEVTAGGVFADLLRLSAYLGASL